MSTTTTEFYERLAAEFAADLQNRFDDNFDFQRFTNGQARATGFSIRTAIKSALQQRGLYSRSSVQGAMRRAFATLGPLLPRLADLYERLHDEQSRELLLKILAFRCLGHTRVRLPLSTPQYWQDVESLGQLADQQDTIDPRFMGWTLHRFDLSSHGLPFCVYSTPKSVYTQMMLQQYRCQRDGLPDVSVKAGDTVIDCGGCWGDTAVHFAHQVGESGRIFTYEFIPSNLEILEKNRSINPELSERIEVVRHAVWDTSGLPVSYTDNGPGSSVSIESTPGAASDVTTLSIDDLVKRRELSQVDFIKMDIEGAELPALHGAVETIRTFRPVLGVAVYHSLGDFVDIPEFVSENFDGYELYLRHFTIHAEETVLFATPAN